MQLTFVRVRGTQRNYKPTHGFFGSIFLLNWRKISIKSLILMMPVRVLSCRVCAAIIAANLTCRGVSTYLQKGGGKNITFLQQFCVGASEPLAINTQICCWPSGVRGPGQASQAESQGQIGSIQHSLAEGSHQSGSNRAKYRERQRAKYPELLQTGAR